MFQSTLLLHRFAHIFDRQPRNASIDNTGKSAMELHPAFQNSGAPTPEYPATLLRFSDASSLRTSSLTTSPLTISIPALAGADKMKTKIVMAQKAKNHSHRLFFMNKSRRRPTPSGVGGMRFSPFLKLSFPETQRSLTLSKRRVGLFFNVVRFEKRHHQHVLSFLAGKRREIDAGVE
jgi:hypothetical protein